MEQEPTGINIDFTTLEQALHDAAVQSAMAEIDESIMVIDSILTAHGITSSLQE